jgi:peroxin-12
MDSPNPSFPSTEGALLAEEWTIDPYSPLPSFLEMILKEEAQQSLRTCLVTVWDAMCDFVSSRIPSIHEQSSTQHARLSNQQYASHAVMQPLSSYTLIANRWKHALKIRLALLLKKVVFVLRQYKSEWMCLLWYVMEREHLRRASCTAVEFWYGMQRNRIVSPKARLVPLSAADQTRLALLYALGPYLRDKVQKMIDRERNNASLRQTRGDANGLYRLVHVSQYLNVLWQSLELATRYKYLIGESPFYDFFSRLTSQVVRRRTQQESASLTSVQSAIQNDELHDDAIGKQLDVSNVTTQGSNLQLIKCVLTLAVSVVGVSWLQWLRNEVYQADASSRQAAGVNNTSVQVPPFPQGVQTTINACPICRRNPHQPTALTTGHVYCLTCILPFVQQHGYCPVTGVKCNEASLIRLYEPRTA